jgi:hypothetical protein
VYLPGKGNRSVTDVDFRVKRHLGEGRGVFWVWVGKPEGKRPLGRPRNRWEDNINMDLQEVK